MTTVNDKIAQVTQQVHSSNGESESISQSLNIVQSASAEAAKISDDTSGEARNIDLVSSNLNDIVSRFKLN